MALDEAFEVMYIADDQGLYNTHGTQSMVSTTCTWLLIQYMYCILWTLGNMCLPSSFLMNGLLKHRHVVSGGLRNSNATRPPTILSRFQQK